MHFRRRQTDWHHRISARCNIYISRLSTRNILGTLVMQLRSETASKTETLKYKVKLFCKLMETAGFKTLYDTMATQR